ncbi:MAG TPA: RluA family pseudouridine synthase [Actinobacteria bacterium]|nr:RluA family pseudouridine synthase [Actinomycetota bacterium]
MRIVVPAEYDGQRCDLILSRLAAISRSQARDLIASGGVTRNGTPVAAPREAVATGTVLEFEPAPPPLPLQPEPVAFGVVYEDAHLAVIDKPAGVVTHPGAGETGPTLAAGVLHRWPSVRGVGAENRWGIVHRLDRDTSGLLVVALDAEAERGLRAAIREHRVVREYLALVHGSPGAPSGTIEAPLERDPVRPTRMRVDSAGRPATTHFRVEERLGALTLLRVTLETGRTHQIRVHLATIGLPVAGDRIYGRTSGSPRTFLHATRLRFDHPLTGTVVDAVSPLPADLAAVLDALS